MSRAEEYRDLLELWTRWWNGPGRRDYCGNILPPLTRTGDALRCLVCSGVEERDGGRCEACLRDVGMRP